MSTWKGIRVLVNVAPSYSHGIKALIAASAARLRESTQRDVSFATHTARRLRGMPFGVHPACIGSCRSSSEAYPRAGGTLDRCGIAAVTLDAGIVCCSCCLLLKTPVSSYVPVIAAGEYIQQLPRVTILPCAYCVERGPGQESIGGLLCFKLLMIPTRLDDRSQ